MKQAPRQARPQLKRIRIDTYVGMALSNVVAFFIILTAAATLRAQGVTEVGTAAEAAKALAPLAGRWAESLFACGIIGTGMLAVPVLAGSACYAIGEARKWRVSLENKPGRTVEFYVAITVATVAGMCLNFLHIDPIRALYFGCGSQRIARRAADGGHYAPSFEPTGHGEVCNPAIFTDRGLGSHCCHVSCINRSAHLVEALRPGLASVLGQCGPSGQPSSSTVHCVDFSHLFYSETFLCRLLGVQPQ